jgi:DNA-binding NarL/FixJ family response regulator
MTSPIIQIDDEVREMNEEELAAFNLQKQEELAQEAAIADKIASRESALAKLAALGLTEEEIASL